MRSRPRPFQTLRSPLAVLCVGAVTLAAAMPADAASRGPRGPQGKRGLSGARGPAGPKGAPGARGATGDKGDPGAAGAAGVKGDKGDTGANGVLATGPGLTLDAGTLAFSAGFADVLATGCPAGQALRAVTLAGVATCADTGLPAVRYDQTSSAHGGFVLVGRTTPVDSVTVPDGQPFLVTATGGIQAYGQVGGTANVSCRLDGPGLGGSAQELMHDFVIPAGATQTDWSFALSDQGGPIVADGSQKVGLLCQASIPNGSTATGVTLYTSRLHLIPVGSLTQG